LITLLVIKIAAVSAVRRNIVLSYKSQPMDWRIILVFTPIVLAISWAVFNIGRAALGQLQLAVRDFKKNQS